ncbi:MAG TPA: Hsp20/alpha crystallin family protein [Nocardioides sp.]|jgi:HSP20 family molecular chaperone IbpA|nr:Hsp20/alpha crystallin family protein [Nocardioides sp.]
MSTTISRRGRDPFFAEFDHLVRAAFGPTVSTGAHQAAFSPAAEAHRDGDDAVIRIELPGVDTSDVSVEVKGRHLVVSGERRDSREEQGEGRRFSEFRYGRFTRSFRLAPSVTAEAVSASYDAGVLTVRVAGAYAEAEGHKIEISAGSASASSSTAEGGESHEG